MVYGEDVIFENSTNIKLSIIMDADFHYDDGKRNVVLGKAQTILLIDDNFDIIENLTEFLEMEGYKIIVANNGELGVERAREFIPDLIICDVLMPGMDGHKVLQLLLDTTRTEAIPFIFSTSMSEKIDRTESLKLGAADYIVKPFELEALLAIIKKWVSTGSQRTR